jgi:hypothetical protein
MADENLTTEKKKQQKKDMKITLISKPIKTDSTKTGQSVEQDKKPQEKKRKGTRGPAWIG